MNKCRNYWALKACYEQLTWNLCGYKWKDITQLTLKDKMRKAIFGSYSIDSELLSYFSEIIRGEPWPQWGIIIIKTGGWSHIICQKWSYEFCWEWLGYNKDYKHMSDTFCPLRQFIIFPLTFFWVCSLNIKLSFSFAAIEHIEKLLLHIVVMIMISMLILSTSLFELYFLNKLKRFKRFRPKYKGMQYKLTLFMIYFYPILWLSLIAYLYSNNSTTHVIDFTIKEIIVAVWILGIIHLISMVYDTKNLYNTIVKWIVDNQFTN